MSSRRDSDLLQFDGTSVLVSGGAGFIGSHLVDRLIEEGAQVRVIDDMSNGLQSNIERWKGNRNFKFMKGDVRNREMMKEAVTDVSIVFHHAAKVSVPESSRDPHTVMDVNIMGTTSILDECRKCDVESVIVASSSSVYGNTPRLPKVESMPTQPISPYGVSKLAQENLAVVFSSTYGLDTVVLRYFNVYGPRQRVGSYAGVIQLFVASALRGEPLFIDGDGQQTRDFTYVDDAVEGSILAALSSKTGARIYNVGGGSRITIESLADRVIVATDSKSKKEFRSPRLGDVRDSLASLEKIRKEIGYEPRWSVEKGLANTVKWMKPRI